MPWLWAATGLLLAALAGILWRRLRLAQQTLLREQIARRSESARLSHLERLAARNSTILQNAMDGFFVLGPDYRFLEVNAAFSRMLGYTEAELLGMKMTDLEVDGPGRDASGVPRWKTGLHHFGTSHRHKDGRLVHLESCVVVLRDEQRKILAGFARDVTERCRAEQSLRASEEEYRNLVQTSRDLIWSVDLEGRWTFVNNAARGIYGCDPENLLRRPMAEVVHPEDRAATAELLAELRAGKPRFRFETRHLHRDGAVVNLIINAVPVRDERGNVVAATGTSADITYIKNAERQLREAHDRFESLVAGMPLGYIVWSQDLRILEWNPAAERAFGYARGEVEGRRAVELLVPAEGQKAFVQMCREALDGHPCRGSILAGRRQDGEKISCEWYTTLLTDGPGGVPAVAALVRDVSERERLESQLRQSQKLESLGVLAGGVAHDFNNLLVGILGNASLALEMLPPNSSLAPMLERVVNAGRRATELTQRMLAYAGRTRCDVKVMDLRAMVEELADFAGAAIPKHVRLTIRSGDELPLIEADSGQMQQVVMNLLINGAEAIGDGPGEVTVSTWAEPLTAERIAAEFADQKLAAGTYVVLEVKDTGCGMTPEVQSRVFDPFFSTKFAGRGLGLSAILGIVRAHHGAISCSSQPGVGTTFRVLFPAVTRTVRTAAGQSGTRTLPAGSTVLVIDDEEDVREVVQAVLESRGIRVLTAENGRRGVEIFREQADRISAVLLDINMPGMSGEAVFRELRTICPDVRVILSTGYSQQEAASQFADAPLAGFVHKPYTASVLVDQIGAALR